MPHATHGRGADWGQDELPACYVCGRDEEEGGEWGNEIVLCDGANCVVAYHQARARLLPSLPPSRVAACRVTPFA